jgi:hypothetical protein
VSEWQPIATLQKGEDVLLAWEDGCIRIGQRYADIENGFKTELDYGDFSASAYTPRDYAPTHWMPLPAPPHPET